MYGLNNNTGNIYKQFDQLNNNNYRFENSANNNYKVSEKKNSFNMEQIAKIAMQLMAG